ncbi:MAG: cellulase family glycosylhydrolase [Pseudomonadota bacterium]
MVTRRLILGAGAALAAFPASAAAPDPFIRRKGAGLTLDGKPYRFVGANLWYGPWLAARPDFGNRARLARELDALLALGVTNLRIIASAETSPLKNAVSPAFRDKGGAWNPDLIDGLTHLLAQMEARGMRAVLYLTNFWEWSGGMMTYLSYVNGGKFIDMNDPAHPWPEFPDMTAQFYANAEAVKLYHEYVASIVKRYAHIPTVMGWQLANEPRPGGSDRVAEPLVPAYYGWIESTAKLIKSIAPNQLVSTGSEGLKGSIERAEVYRRAHAIPEIDYLTAHIWPLNWSWLDAKNIAGTHKGSLRKVGDYIAKHIALATELGKPLVIEEFGYPRDGGSYDPKASTRFKDEYYRLIYAAVEQSVRSSGPIVGSNFWAWNGEGRAAHADYRFRSGDTAWLGDPPHEPQGWYGVFDSDASTKAIIRAHAQALAG